MFQFAVKPTIAFLYWHLYPRSTRRERRMGMPTYAIIKSLNVSNRPKTLKSRYKYRIYPNHIQITKLN